ncbi:MAG: cupin domain-containing protein [Alphaproteobacteria bacterium]
MKPVFFDRSTARVVPVYDGKAVSYRMLTRQASGFDKLGLHVSEGPAGLAGQGQVVVGRDEVVFLLDGSMEFVIAGERRNLTAGQGVLIPADTPFDWAAGPDGWKAVIIFTPPVE